MCDRIQKIKKRQQNKTKQNETEQNRSAEVISKNADDYIVLLALTVNEPAEKVKIFLRTHTKRIHSNNQKCFVRL